MTSFSFFPTIDVLTSSSSDHRVHIVAWSTSKFLLHIFDIDRVLQLPSWILDSVTIPVTLSIRDSTYLLLELVDYFYLRRTTTIGDIDDTSFLRFELYILDSTFGSSSISVFLRFAWIPTWRDARILEFYFGFHLSFGTLAAARFWILVWISDSTTGGTSSK